MKESIAPKVAKLILMLGSEHDGEVVAAARALSRTLKSAGLDLYAVADAASRCPAVVHTKPAIRPSRQDNCATKPAVHMKAPRGTRGDWVRMVAFCLSVAEAAGLEKWKQAYLRTLDHKMSMGWSLSENQQDCLFGIFNQIDGGV